MFFVTRLSGPANFMWGHTYMTSAVGGGGVSSKSRRKKQSCAIFVRDKGGGSKKNPSYKSRPWLRVGHFLLVLRFWASLNWYPLYLRCSVSPVVRRPTKVMTRLFTAVVSLLVFLGSRDGQRSRSLILIFKLTTGDLDLLGGKDHQWWSFKMILIFDLQFFEIIFHFYTKP